MNYAKIDKNDVTNGEGVCVSFWVQGCSIRCFECHNESIWDFDGGTRFAKDTIDEILAAISANGIQRNFSVLGGEPLALQNIEGVAKVVAEVRGRYPKIKIYLWTGYSFMQLFAGAASLNPQTSSFFTTTNNQYFAHLHSIFDNVDYIIDGPYIAAERDITLKWRGSRNQHIWKKEDNQWIIKEE